MEMENATNDVTKPSDDVLKIIDQEFSAEFLELAFEYAKWMLQFSRLIKVRQCCDPDDHYYDLHKGCYYRHLGATPHMNINGDVIFYSEVPRFVREYQQHPDRARYEAIPISQIREAITKSPVISTQG